MLYVEKDCKVTFQGKEFESGGAFVTPDRIVAYLAEDGVLTDWHGKKLGTYKITSTWPTPRSWVSSTMSQVEAKVDNVVYTGRSCGVGMIYRGKRKKG